jgi:tetratricopeptide (TPR) repeat protein
MSECPHPAKLLQLIADGEYVPHLRECEKCRTFVDAATEAVDAFKDTGELEAAVRAEIDALLADSPEHRWGSMFLDSRNVHLHRSVVVRDLLRRAEELSGSKPRQALNLSSAAISVCDAMIAADRPPAPELRFEVLKLHSSLLRDVGMLDEALSVLGRAWTVADTTEHREQYRATLSLCAAIIYVEPDVADFDEAIKLAEAAGAVLDVCGDQRRAVIARHTKAYALAVMDRFEAAVPLLRGVVDEITEAGGTTHDAAMAHSLLAWCYVQLGLFGDALDHARIAEHLHSERGETIDAARAAHVAARAIAGMGHFDDVKDEFTRTADVVFQAELFDVWCVLRLDYIATALAADECADVRADAEGVARVAMTVGKTDSTLRRRLTAEACDYLRIIAIRNMLTYEVADYVRNYVDRNSKQKPAKFIPPSGAGFAM